MVSERKQTEPERLKSLGRRVQAFDAMHLRKGYLSPSSRFLAAFFGALIPFFVLFGLLLLVRSLKVVGEIETQLIIAAPLLVFFFVFFGFMVAFTIQRSAQKGTLTGFVFRGAVYASLFMGITWILFYGLEVGRDVVAAVGTIFS